MGAGDTGQAIKKRVKNSVLVDADPGKVIILGRENPDWKIVGGDASDPNVLKTAGIETADYLILTTNKDYFNQKIAMTARELADEVRIVSVLHNIKSFSELKEAGINHLISPISETIDAFLNHVIPVAEEITEIAISQESPGLGKTVGEVKLPQDTIIGAILRGNHLVKPEPDMVLEKGDVISLVSLGHLEQDIVDAMIGSQKTIVPIDNLVCLLKTREDMIIVKEVITLASKISACCHFVFPETMIKFREEIEKAAAEREVTVGFTPLTGNILERFRRFIEELDPAEHPMIVIPQRKLSVLRYQFPAKYVEELISEMKYPVYIPKSQNFERFERILHLIDDQPHCGLQANYAIGMSRVCNAKLVSLVLHNPENNYAEEILIHAKRICKVYGIEVEEEIIEGNPTIDVILEVRRTPNQLVVINYLDTILRRDIIRKIINEAEASVLLMK